MAYGVRRLVMALHLPVANHVRSPEIPRRRRRGVRVEGFAAGSSSSPNFTLVQLSASSALMPAAAQVRPLDDEAWGPEHRFRPIIARLPDGLLRPHASASSEGLRVGDGSGTDLFRVHGRLVPPYRSPPSAALIAPSRGPQRSVIGGTRLTRQWHTPCQMAYHPHYGTH